MPGRVRGTADVLRGSGGRQKDAGDRGPVSVDTDEMPYKVLQICGRVRTDTIERRPRATEGLTPKSLRTGATRRSVEPPFIGGSTTQRGDHMPEFMDVHTNMRG